MALKGKRFEVVGPTKAATLNTSTLLFTTLVANDPLYDTLSLFAAFGVAQPPFEIEEMPVLQYLAFIS